MSNILYTLEDIGQEISQRVRDKFSDRPIPSEKVSENFLHQVVQSIFTELHDEGKLNQIPEFQVLNKTSMEDRFSGSIPDFSKHINLIGLGKDTGPDEYGVMNVAIDGEDAETIQQQAEQIEHETQPEPDESATSPSSSQETPEQPPPNTDPDPDPEWQKHARVIKGGQS